jgi:hypothetical protein
LQPIERGGWGACVLGRFSLADKSPAFPQWKRVFDNFPWFDDVEILAIDELCSSGAPGISVKPLKIMNY